MSEVLLVSMAAANKIATDHHREAPSRGDTPFGTRNPDEATGENQERGQCVLHFRDPRHGLDIDRVQQKQKRSNPSIAHTETLAEKAQQDCIDGMQQNIRKVVACRTVAEGCGEHPKDRQKQRVVVR